MSTTKGPRVLIAEDELHSRLLLKTILTSMNCEVVGEARTGAEAVEMYRQLKPHMLLLDVNMPRMTGDEALREIRKEFPLAFVILITSVADQEVVERCLELGAAHYIRKDTPIAEIKTTIKETWSDFVASLCQRAPDAPRS
ncbi:MAG: response regulator [Methylotetracoccus sp.]